MAASLECPEVARWHALFADRLPDGQRAAYEDHLESCPSCQSRLDQDSHDAAPLVGLLRRVGRRDVAEPGPALREALERLHRASPPPQAATADDLHFLTPSPEPGLLGTLGDYRVEAVLGRGGMGLVLRAFEPALGRHVALKVLAPALAGSPEARRRFTREARAAAAVCHDNVVAVHRVEEHHGLPFLVMRLVDGESLQCRLDREGCLEVGEVVRLGLQAARGLQAAHARGLIHRDVKPANLLLEGGSGQLKITDFGLARAADDTGLTREGVLAGTPEYMAPEQARGEPLDHRADLFSLGAVLYALCAGVPPFRAPTTLGVLRRVCDEPPPPLRSLSPATPAWLEAFIMRLLAKDPGRRLQSAGAAADLLEGYLAHLKQPDAVPAPLLPSLPAASPRRFLSRGWLTGLLLLVLSGTGLILWLAQANGPEQPQPAPRLNMEMFHLFKGNPEAGQGWEPVGPGAERLARFEPEGLRITLPAGWGGERPSTGVGLQTPVKGDFEITMGFEVLQEPTPEETGRFGTRLSLGVFLDTPRPGLATVSRSVGTKAGPVIVTWTSLWDDALGKARPVGKPISMPLRAGSLRLVRTGSDLLFYAAEGPQAEFALLNRLPFGPEDLKEVRIAGSTGGREAALDVRITDLRIRAESLPERPAASESPSAPPSRSWLVALLVLGLVATLAALSLGASLYLRRARRAGTPPPSPADEGEEADKESAPVPILLSCPHCGKGIRARAALAGKKIRCPGCARPVLVAEEAAGGTDPAAT